jgi:hypothetical protein
MPPGGGIWIWTQLLAGFYHETEIYQRLSFDEEIVELIEVLAPGREGGHDSVQVRVAVLYDPHRKLRCRRRNEVAKRSAGNVVSGQPGWVGGCPVPPALVVGQSEKKRHLAFGSKVGCRLFKILPEGLVALSTNGGVKSGGGCRRA